MGQPHRLTEKNFTDMLAVCSVCGPVTMYTQGKRDGRWRYTCATRHNEVARRKHRKTYPVGPRCECCGTKGAKNNPLCWDHDHATDERRGTLCRKCNMALGLLAEDSKRVLSLYRYASRTR